MTVSLSSISTYEQFVGAYGSEAVDKARQAGYIDDQNRLVSGKEWKDVASWAQNKGYKVKDLPEPGASSPDKLEKSLQSYENISMLFHSILKQIRTAQREESYASQHRVVETMQHAADKRIEAAGKLQLMAGISMGLAIGGFAAGVAMGALSGVFQGIMSGITSAINAAVKAVTEAIGKVFAKIVDAITKIVAQAVDKVVKAACDAATKVGKEGAKEAANAAVKAVQQAAKEMAREVTKAVKDQLMQVVRELTKGMPKSIQKLAEKMVDKISKAVGKLVEKTFTKVMNQAIKQLAKSVEPLANPKELSRTLTKEIMETVTKSLKNVMEHTLTKASSGTLLDKMVRGSMQAIGNPMTASQMGMQAVSGASSFAQSTGQAESQRIQAEGDKISAQAEFVRGEKQRLDDYTSGINDTMRTVRQKLAEMNEAQNRAMQAAAKI